MTRHFSTRAFFRQVPNYLLKRYFQNRRVFAELNFAAMKESQPDELFRAWLNLPDKQRHEMDAELREIFELSNENGFRAIVDEALWQFTNDTRSEEEKWDFVTFLQETSELRNHFERAMVTFLDYKHLWKGAVLFHHADILPYWRKRKNLPDVPAAVDEGSLKQLANLICNYFHYMEGRGKNCVVEPFRRGELDYFFAYPEDYSQHSVEWVDGEFGRRPHNPAFEVIYVYSQKDHTLDLNFRGSNKALEPLQGMFATAILKLSELPADPDDGRVYDLNVLRHKSFDFVWDERSGIQQVAVKRLRFSSKATKGQRITLETDAMNDPRSLYELVEQVSKSSPLHRYNVTQAEIGVLVSVENKREPKSVTIRVTYPNYCSLKYDEVDLKLREMLHASGIEPRTPQTEKETAEG